MKLAKQGIHEERGKEEKTGFSRLKPLGDSLKRATVVVAILAGATLNVHCSGGGPDPTPDSGGDGGSMSDSGPTQDGGSDGGAGGLCAQYPNGSWNNNAFSGGTIMKPGSNTANYLMFLNALGDQGGTEYAVFGLYPQDLSSPIQYVAFSQGQTKTINIPSVGDMNFQLCSMTASPCSSPPGGPVTGDTHCIAEVAADRPWAPVH